MQIKTNFELPRGEDDVKQRQRLAQDLSKNFKALSAKVNTITDTFEAYSDVSANYNIGGGAYANTFTLSHGLGKTPSGFQLIDFTSNLNVGFWELYSFSRVSWTDTQVVIKMNYIAQSYGASGSFKIRVF